MTMRRLVVAALLATALGCGGGMSSNSASRLSGGDTAPSDGGATSPTGTCDCTGMALPDICMVCTDGSDACAHFICVDGMCETQICP